MTVLTDNRTNDPRLETEHGLCVYLSTTRCRILLDTGASAVCIRNAERLGIDLSTLDYIFISHGHSDHAGGLRYLIDLCPDAKIIVSPHALIGKYFSDRNGLHSITAQWPDIPADRLLTIDHTCDIADGLKVIANISQIHPLPLGNRHLFIQDADGNYIPDDFKHELALYVDGFLFSGCAHNGLLNILSSCPWPVTTLLGGFHLLDNHESESDLTALATTLLKSYPNTQFYTSHCTGDTVFQTLSPSWPHTSIPSPQAQESPNPFTRAPRPAQPRFRFRFRWRSAPSLS